MWLYILLIIVLLWWVHEHLFVKIIRFHRPTCPYCVNTEEEWKKFKRWALFSKYRCVEINLSNASPREQKIISQYEIKSVPTIMLLNPDGTATKYNGQRDCRSLIQWVS